MAIFTHPLSRLAQEFHLEILFKSNDYESIQITVEDVNRPALQLAGFFEHFEPVRLQVIGMVEHTYLNNMSSEERTVVFDRFFSYRPPALIFTRNLVPCEECLVMARKHNITILQSSDTTSDLISRVIATLMYHLAPRVTRHGVLVEVHGEGLLLLGDSGVGKSETAIELVKRGHRLIADDAVELKKTGARQLTGSAPALIRHYIELRGIGVTNVANLFGMGAVKDTANVDLIVNLEVWRDDVFYDRLGVDDQFTTILDVEIPTLTIPVKPGRNLAVILEVAAMNNRQKRAGYNAAKEFAAQINRHIDETTASL